MFSQRILFFILSEFWNLKTENRIWYKFVFNVFQPNKLYWCVNVFDIIKNELNELILKTLFGVMQNIAVQMDEINSFVKTRRILLSIINSGKKIQYIKFNFKKWKGKLSNKT